MNIKTVIRKWSIDVTNVQLMKRKVASQKGRITKLEDNFHKLQHLVKDDILALTAAEAGYKSNSYPTYESAVAEIDRKYRGTADWGVLQTGSIIDLRAAFIVGDGLIVSAEGDEAEKELEWVEDFLEYNDLDREVVQEFAKEAEIEGKIALKLALEEDKEEDEEVDEEDKKWRVSVRFISWLDKKYKVITNPQDYLEYKQLKWKATGTTKAETLDAKEFVYKKFGGRIRNTNEAAPKIMKCLPQIESFDKALWDWRTINHIFAGPVLYAECGDKTEVDLMLKAFDNKNFKLKKILAGTAKMSFIKLDVGGIDSIEKELADLAKVISGATGVPVHWLGFVDLMSNRATAEDLINMINGATTKERQTWIGAYEEVIKKAMVMWNEGAEKGMGPDKKLDPDKIKVDIPIITKMHYDRLQNIFLPAVIAGKISDKTFLTMIPGIDVEAEMKEKEKKEASELEELKRDNEERDARDLEANLTNRGSEDD